MLSTYSSDVFIKLSHGGGQRPHTSVFVTTWHLWQPELPKKQKKQLVLLPSSVILKNVSYTTYFWCWPYYATMRVFVFASYDVKAECSSSKCAILLRTQKTLIFIGLFWQRWNVSLMLVAYPNSASWWWSIRWGNSGITSFLMIVMMIVCRL